MQYGEGSYPRRDDPEEHARRYVALESFSCPGSISMPHRHLTLPHDSFAWLGVGLAAPVDLERSVDTCRTQSLPENWIIPLHRHWRHRMRHSTQAAVPCARAERALAFHACRRQQAQETKFARKEGFQGRPSSSAFRPKADVWQAAVGGGEAQGGKIVRTTARRETSTALRVIFILVQGGPEGPLLVNWGGAFRRCCSPCLCREASMRTEKLTMYRETRSHQCTTTITRRPTKKSRPGKRRPTRQ